MAFLHHWNEVAADTARPSVSKRLLNGAGASLVRLEIAAGAEAARHAHPHEQFVQVLSGRGRLQTEDGTQAFAAGHIFHFPSGTWHAAVFEEDTVLVEVNIAPRA